jgi:hypothetical protein
MLRRGEGAQGGRRQGVAGMSDDEDRDLFGEPYYPSRPGYVRGSDTSHDAADSLDESALTALRAKIFAVIDVRGEYGATCDEIEVALSMRHQTASARVRELALGALIFDTGQRRSTRSGRGARVYCTRRNAPDAL